MFGAVWHTCNLCDKIRAARITGFSTSNYAQIRKFISFVLVFLRLISLTTKNKHIPFYIVFVKILASRASDFH